MIGLRRTGYLALVAIQAQSRSPTILHSPLMVSQLQLLDQVGINGFSAWAPDNLPILSLLFSTQLSSVRLLYISPPRVSLCYKACTDSIYQIQTCIIPFADS